MIKPKKVSNLISANYRSKFMNPTNNGSASFNGLFTKPIIHPKFFTTNPYIFMQSWWV